jgi:hypothetical protein
MELKAEMMRRIHDKKTAPKIENNTSYGDMQTTGYRGKLRFHDGP